jgi:hypothetical protein
MSHGFISTNKSVLRRKFGVRLLNDKVFTLKSFVALAQGYNQYWREKASARQNK